MNILAIETSCDETAVSVVRDGRTILSNPVISQIDIHRIYGGVVPEIASRKHIECIGALYGQALQDAGLTLQEIGAIAVTFAPGLIGALLVGVNFAKGLALCAKKPLIPTHHIRSHVAANYLAYPELAPPFVALIASGGHSHIVQVEDYTTYRILGQTRDDAAGEAFDKVARVLGLPYPGGAPVDALAQQGNPNAISFPQVSFADAPYDFSFSGVKTAVINFVHTAEQKGEPTAKADVSASFNEAVAQTLCSKLLLAARETGAKQVVLAGGVGANSRLRTLLQEQCSGKYALFIPPLSLCGDNAAMVGAQGYYEFLAGHCSPLSLNAYATMPINYCFGQHL